MMELEVQSSIENNVSTINIADSVFSVAFNEPLIHQVVTAYLAGSRAGTKAHRSRSQVRGGGKKPWRQKGTGRARAGTIRSPIWRGGGVTFAAEPRDYSKKVNKKMYRVAMRSIFSELIRQGRLVCIDEFDITEAKTKLVNEKLKKIQLHQVLVVTDFLSENLCLAVKNIPYVDVVNVNKINPHILVASKNILATKAAINKIESWLV